jgi:hypothetical protein
VTLAVEKLTGKLKDADSLEIENELFYRARVLSAEIEGKRYFFTLHPTIRVKNDPRMQLLLTAENGQGIIAIESLNSLSIFNANFASLAISSYPKPAQEMLFRALSDSLLKQLSVLLGSSVNLRIKGPKDPNIANAFSIHLCMYDGNPHEGNPVNLVFTANLFLDAGLIVMLANLLRNRPVAILRRCTHFLPACRCVIAKITIFGRELASLRQGDVIFLPNSGDVEAGKIFIYGPRPFTLECKGDSSKITVAQICANGR